MVASAISIRPRRTRGYEISLRQSIYTGLAQPDVKMYGLSALKCTACTSSSILAVVSEIVWRSRPVMGKSLDFGWRLRQAKRLRLSPWRSVEWSPKGATVAMFAARADIDFTRVRRFGRGGAQPRTPAHPQGRSKVENGRGLRDSRWTLAAAGLFDPASWLHSGAQASASQGWHSPGGGSRAIVAM